jgi:hypothetical protein
MTVLITLTTAGADTGPFNLYSDVNGYTSAFAVGVNKLDLEAGYPSDLVPDGTTTIKVQSVNDLCNNFVLLPTGITTTSTTTSSSSTTTTTTTTIISIACIYLCSSAGATCSDSNTETISNYAYVAVDSGWLVLNIDGKYVVKDMIALPDTLLYDYNSPGTIIDTNSIDSHVNTINGTTSGIFMIADNSSEGGVKLLLNCDGIGNATSSSC